MEPDGVIIAIFGLALAQFGSVIVSIVKMIIDSKNGKKNSPASSKTDKQLADAIFAMISEMKLLRADFQEHDKESAVVRTKIDHIHSKIT